jgi:hypothetical protein
MGTRDVGCSSQNHNFIQAHSQYNYRSFKCHQRLIIGIRQLFDRFLDGPEKYNRKVTAHSRRDHGPLVIVREDCLVEYIAQSYPEERPKRPNDDNRDNSVQEM